MKHLVFLVVIVATSIALCACSQVRPGASVVVASEVLADLATRHGVHRVAFKSKLENVCVYEAHFDAPHENFEHLTIMASDRNGCARLERPFVKIDSNDDRTLAFVQSLIHGSRRSEFLQALKDNGVWDVVVVLDKNALNGTFLTHEDGSQVLLVPSGINTAIQFDSTEPLQFTVERWQ